MSLGQGNLLYNRYRIVEILGRGGMGAVYRAVDESLGVDVAVKENLFTTDDYARQFRMEAVILAGLRHPNLPRVTDHFVLDGQGQYLVMDYIEGDDLRQRIEKQGTLPESEAIRIGAAVCDALAYLHSRKPPILHRDIKLGNVKLLPEGGVSLVDFGLAKMGWEHEETMTGARAMTPGYSPPEQYGSARTDARSDIYSLGATLYAAITGVVPEDSLMRAVDGLTLTPLRKHRPEISPRLASVIEKAMETSPSNRYQTAEEFKNALTGIADAGTQTSAGFPFELPDSEADSAPEAPKKQRAGFGRTILLAFLLVVTALGLILIDPANRRIFLPFLLPVATTTPTATVTATATLLPTFTVTEEVSATPTKPATPTKTLLPTATFTPTGEIQTPVVPPATDIVTPPTETPTATPTPFGGGGGEISYATVRDNVAQIYVANADGTNVRQLTNDLNGACDFDWAPDGKRLVYVSPCTEKAAQYPNSGLYIFDVETGLSTRLLPAPQGEFDPAWSPDGGKIAFTSMSDGTWQIYSIDLATSEVTLLTSPEGNTQSRYAAWLPDGSKLVYTARRFGVLQLWTMNPDGSDKIRLVFNGTGLSDYLPAWSPDNTFVLFSETNFDLAAPSWLMRYNVGMARGDRVSAVPLPVVDVNFSPDGLWIAYETSDTRNQDVYFYNLLDGSLQRLTTDPAVDFDPKWRP